MAVVEAVSPARGDVVSAIAAASAGDTVLIPSTGGGSVTYSQQVTVDKAVHLMGSGRDANGTVINSATPNEPVFRLQTPASGVLQVSNMRFIGGDPDNYSGLAFAVDDGENVRITAIDFRMTPPGNWTTRWYGQRGLVDHCYWRDCFGIWYYGNGEIEWTKDLDLGSALWPFLEDSVFDHSDNFYGSTSGAVLDTNYGGRIVARYNSMHHAFIETHDRARSTLASPRGFELYHNTLTSGDNVWKGFDLTAGSGVIWNNTFTGDFTFPVGFYDYKTDDPRTIPACDGTDPDDGNTPGGSGYLCQWQIGSKYVGLSGVPTDWGSYAASDPVYLWGNTYNGSPMTPGVSGANSPNKIQSGRDYINGTAKPGYTPYTYPHPLQSAYGGGIILAAPAWLRHRMGL